MKGTIKRKVFKKYTIHHKCVDNRKNEKTIKNNLLEARILARQYFRQGRFIKLINAKGILLPI